MYLPEREREVNDSNEHGEAAGRAGIKGVLSQFGDGEQQCIISFRFGGHGGSFSRLLYDIKASQETASGTDLSVTPYIIRHHGLKCDSFEPSFNVKEITEMTMEDTALLLASLVSCNQYDVIVVDTEGYMEERMQAVLEQAGVLIWVLLDDLMSMYKSGVWMDQLELEDPALFGSLKKRSQFIVNRYTGQLVNGFPARI